MITSQFLYLGTHARVGKNTGTQEASAAFVAKKEPEMGGKSGELKVNPNEQTYLELGKECKRLISSEFKTHARTIIKLGEGSWFAMEH